MASRTTDLALSTLAGAIAALLVTWGLANENGSSTESPTYAPETASFSTTRPGGDRGDSRVAELNRRVIRVEREMLDREPHHRTETREGPQSDSRASADNASISLSDEEAEAFKRRDASMAAFSTDPRDSEWADSMESQLREKIGESFAGGREAIDEVECRTSKCIVSLFRDSLGESLERRSLAIESGIWAPDCRRHGFGDGDTYKLVFDCA